ncbi:ATP-binding protein [Actinocrinis sp.]|uniref:ATP-binding protein n=1 Tax=Actinocrinis sp. TaxID=1920516 RepID=UPI002B74232A|nr:AAA family ATPase [Actinocrinis sp.]HXR73692.1 AAA family ATPase [Actinocrinis sp.]
MTQAPAPLAGRERELQSIRSLIQNAERGNGGALWIVGEPGIGKSALLDAFEQDGRGRGFRVLRGAARQLEAGLPFAAIGSCLGIDGRDPPAAASRVGEALRAGQSPEESSFAPYRELVIIETILGAVDEWCAAGPVAILLDDAQWADRPSLLALGRIGSMAGHHPIAIGLTTRAVPQNEDLVQLLDDLESQGGEALHPGPLPAPQVAELIERLLGARPDRGLLQLVTGAAGNPLYVTELVAALSREGRIRIAGGAASYDADITATTGADPGPRERAQLPGTLAEIILRRLDFLSRPARSTLQLAAALGEGLNVAELAVILGKSPVELYAMIEEAVRAGLLIDGAGELVFRHDLIRQALSESLPATVQDGLRTQAAHALADSGAAVERVVRYLSDDTALDSRMLDWLAGSADALVVRAPRAAVELLKRARTRVEPSDPRNSVFCRQLVRALLWVGEPYRAEQAARAGLAKDDDRDAEVALRELLIHACFQQGRIRLAGAEAQEAMRLPGLTVPQATRFEFLAMQCRLTVGGLDPAEEPAARRMMAVDDGEVRAYGLNYLSCLRFMTGRYAEALELVEQARMAIAERDALPEWTSGNELNRAICLAELDRLPEAAEAFESGTRRAEAHGSFYWSWYRMGTAGVHVLAGRWDDALAEIKAGLDTAEALGPRGLNSGWGLRSQQALLAAHRGDLETAVGLLHADEPVRRETFYGYLRLWAEALVYEAQDQPLASLDLLFEAWQKAGELRRHRGLHYVCPDMARLAATLGDTQRGRQLADDVELLAGAEPVPSMRATARLCRALAQDDPELMRQAEQDYLAAARPLYQAYAAENAAALFARDGRLPEARAELATATEVYEGLEARWDLARAEQRLRREGVRRSGQGTRPLRPKSGWASLTETERRIAALVAEGNSNPAIASRLFISRRTVQSHVSSILAKLNLTSRVELAVVAHQHAGD